MIGKYIAAAAALVIALPACAEVVDGTLDASYGAATATVLYDPALASYDFMAPTPFAEKVGYSIYLKSDADAVYGFLQTTGGTGAGSFANLYFDLNPSVGDGSDLGFEITNGRAFIPGINNQYSDGTSATPLSGLTYALSSDGSGIEFSIANNLFMNKIAGLDYQYYQGDLPTSGDPITLRLSQSFNYTVAGGPTYGPNRLGSVTLGGASDVPEPSSWAMMLAGFAVVGFALRRRRDVAVFA